MITDVIASEAWQSRGVFGDIEDIIPDSRQA